MKNNEFDSQKDGIATLRPVRSGEMSILVVDDDSEDVQYLSELLEESFKYKAKLTIESAANFDEAMLAVINQDFDVVILDYQLGYLNGLNVQDAINKERPELPIVFITGQGNEKVAVAAIQHGALDYLIKDELSIAKLSGIIDQVFNGQAEPSEKRKSEKKVFLSKDTNYSQFFLSVDQAFNKLANKNLFLGQSDKLNKLFMQLDAWMK